MRFIRLFGAVRINDGGGGRESLRSVLLVSRSLFFTRGGGSGFFFFYYIYIRVEGSPAIVHRRGLILLLPLSSGQGDGPLPPPSVGDFFSFFFFFRSFRKETLSPNYAPRTAPRARSGHAAEGAAFTRKPITAL